MFGCRSCCFDLQTRTHHSLRFPLDSNCQWTYPRAHPFQHRHVVIEPHHSLLPRRVCYHHSLLPFIVLYVVVYLLKRFIKLFAAPEVFKRLMQPQVTWNDHQCKDISRAFLFVCFVSLRSRIIGLCDPCFCQCVFRLCVAFPCRPCWNCHMAYSAAQLIWNTVIFIFIYLNILIVLLCKSSLIKTN